MAIQEIYIKLVTSFPKDPKVRSLAQFGADAGLARDLYVQMCLYCKDMLSDGFVPEYELGVLVWPLDLDHGKQVAKQLASVELTKEGTKDGASGWWVLAYLKRNPSKEDVERLSKVRAEAGRTGGKATRKPAGRSSRRAKSEQGGKQLALQNESNTVSVSGSVKTTDPETEIQTPTESAELTPTQRSKPITDAYHEAQPMCKWPAINGIVVLAIKSGKYSDDQIHDAMLRLAENGKSVTVENLRLEIEGFAPSTANGKSGAPGPDRARGWAAAGRAFDARVGQSGKELSA